jgi:signal transduction histidine kinase
MDGDSPPGRPRGWTRELVPGLALFVAYTATAKVGLSFDALGGIATTVWPPTGIALAALVLRGPGLWPVVAAAAFAVNATTGLPLWGAAIIAVGNTLEAVIGAALLRRFGFDRRLTRLRDVLLLVGPAALVSPLVSASFGLLAAALGRLHPSDSYPTFWSVWWIGDVMGNLLVAPLICAWAVRPRLSRHPSRWLEATLLVVATVAISTITFRRLFPVRPVELLRGTYVLWPVLLWAALRFEQRGITVALALVSAIAVTASASSVDSFFRAPSLHERLLMTQFYMAVTAVSMLVLAAAVSERRVAIAARDEFISIASHELKTPLTALKLRLYALQRLGARGAATGEGNIEQRRVEALEAANGTADRLVSLIDNLLDVSRVTAGRLVLRIEQVDLAGLVEEVASRLREQAAEAGTTIDIRVPEGIVGAWDRTRIEQVVTNLLSNAIRYGRGRPVVILAERAGDRARVKVVDTGIGIARADQSRIFRAFEQVRSNHQVGGLGLGLYIGRQIANAHGGGLSVDSTPGRGATFILELPLRAPAAGERATS